MKIPDLPLRDVLRHCRTFPITIWERPRRKPPIRNTGGTMIAGAYRSEALLYKLLCEAQQLGCVTCTTHKYPGERAHSFKLTDAGRLEARDGENNLSVEEARAMHDSDLQNVWGDHPVAQRVLSGRTKAAAHIRLVVARVYARGDMMSFSQWHVAPCLTDKGTIGVLDIAKGTAWDTGVAALPEVFDLGVVEEVYAAANNGLSATVSFDGEPVQSQGSAVVDGKVVPPNMPAGWRQIALPSWRGFEGTSPYRPVPASEFPPESWIEPVLVTSGLMTCYGKPGESDAAKALTKTFGWHVEYGEYHHNMWPQGVPSWIDS